MLASDLTQRVEERRVRALGELVPARQAELGQYFTPQRAATLIASMLTLPQSGSLRLLDPGAGVGSLTAAVVARVIEEAPQLEIELVAVEVDDNLSVHLDATLDDCTTTAAANGVKAKSARIQDDFIRLLTGPPEADGAVSAGSFDLVVMNPPYKKLNSRSIQRRDLAEIGVECPNLYAAFLALGTVALRNGGQISAITPRSFANGVYFAQFRHFLLDRLSIDHIHAFESRSTVFSDTGVLQENVILTGTRAGTRRTVRLSTSIGHTDGAHRRSVDYREVVHTEDTNLFIRIPSAEDDTQTVDLITNQPCTLFELGLKASTGKVVDFRARDYLRKNPETGSTPLIYPGNIRAGVVQWPREFRKAQGFAASDEFSRKQLIPSGHYVFVKRFSSKEEKRRVVAAVWDPSSHGNGPIAVENHLNVIHKNGSGLDRDVAVGISLYLNSSVVDQYFRTFSGHTQVNATDLKSMRFPDETTLRSIGQGQPMNLPEQNEIDSLVMTRLGQRGDKATW